MGLRSYDGISGYTFTTFVRGLPTEWVPRGSSLPSLGIEGIFLGAPSLDPTEGFITRVPHALCPRSLEILTFQASRQRARRCNGICDIVRSSFGGATLDDLLSMAGYSYLRLCTYDHITYISNDDYEYQSAAFANFCGTSRLGAGGSLVVRIDCNSCGSI